MIVEIGKNKIELYDSIQNMGILRLQKFNKYQMIAAQVGNSFADYDKRTAETYRYLQSGMVPEAIQSLNNRRQLVFNSFEEYTPTGRAMAMLVKTINEREYKDFSPNALDEIVKRLEEVGFTYDHLLQSVSEVKKN